jgi:hypothetical protein
MKAILSLPVLLGGVGIASSVTPARADGDDAAWIKTCVNGNKREGATPAIKNLAGNKLI